MSRRWLAIVALAVVAASVVVAAALALPPELDQPAQGDITEQATGPDGKVVSWPPVTATDPEEGPIELVCTPASGSTFSIAGSPHGVTCSWTDAEGNPPVSHSFSVTVIAPPNTPPTVSISVSSPVEATSPAGAPVYYSVTVFDAEDDPDHPPHDCPDSPVSGSTFPLGNTTITCSATDSGGLTGGPKSESVTVQDTTVPTLSLPDNIPVTATSPTPVPYSASASDTVDTSVSANCLPTPGSTFGFGTTTVNCTATDDSGNSASGSFTVTVQDPGAPEVTVPANMTLEANSAAGSVAIFTDPAPASDNKDGSLLLAPCSPSSGSLFPLGPPTTVTCSVTDSDGNTGSASFTVTVQDTTPPVLTVPGQLIIGSEGGVSTSSPVIAAWLSFVTAADLVDPSPILTKPAPATFPVGLTAVTFTATDASGNTTEKTTGISVVSPGTPGSVTPSSTVIPLSVQPDPAPDNVRNVKATPGNRRILLSWSLPAEADFDGVLVTRRPGKGRSEESVVYKGKQTSVVDTSVVNGVSYRYLIVAYDKGGNRSVGVGIVAVAKLQLLLAPGDGARVTGPPLLKWKKVKNAAYYNVQLYRNQRKVNSRWPAGTSLRLTASWAYDGHRFRLGRGCYDWWVWPGFGKKAGARYGEALGHSTFCVKSKPKAA